MNGASGRREPVTAWPDGWMQIKVPLPFSLRWVNAYLLPEPGGGWTLIDPGLHTEEAVALWEAVLKERRIGFGSIERIVLTHQHPDHYGLAGWFQERSGAPVYMSRAARDYTLRLWGPKRSFETDLNALFKAHGMPDVLREGIAGHLESFVAKVSPQPAVDFIEAGGRIAMNGLDWETIAAPGHARGQLLFYQRESKRIICGDQVLPRITPNIGLVPGPDEDSNPLRAFLDHLTELAMYDVKLAFPGHRDPFPNFADRIAELIAHHERRLQEIAAMLAEPLTGYEVCIRLFGARIADDMHHLRFAMAETLAHLVELEAAGAAVRTEQGGVARFRAAANIY